MESIKRQTYLDWLRILSITGVLFFHAAMPFVAEDGWHLKNAETSNLLMESNFFLHLFRMPLLFFISGTVSYYMMRKRSAAAFIGLRFRRLFIPLLAGMFIIVPPQIYMERLAGGYQGRFWSWYPDVFNFVPYPKGSFSWHHLWFIAYLFIYDILLAPLFSWMSAGKSDTFKNLLESLSRGKRVYLLMIPGVVWYALFSRKYPETNDLVNDGGYFIYWIFFLLAGFICVVQSKLMDSLERNRRFALTIGFLAIMFLNYLRWNKIEPGHQDWPFTNNLFIYLFEAIKPLVAWGWVLALIGYGKHYLTHQTRALNYMNQAAYPFYILHQTVIVILVYYFIPLSQESILSKYIYTLGFTFFITLLTYHLLIRPFAVTRLLFGMKPKNPDIKQSERDEYTP